MGFQCSSIAIDQIPEEIKQFRFIKALFRLVLDVFTDFSNQLED
jgi:hypothetical protein